MSNNKKQSIVNPYTGKKMEMNTFSGKELMWKLPTAATDPNDKLTDDEYYDYWEDDRLYQDSEARMYE